MIQPGESRTMRPWGRFNVLRVAELPEPSVVDTRRWGRISFRPTITEIEWESGTKQLWFPQYTGPVGRERYRQDAPIMSGEEFLSLLRESMKQRIFSEAFFDRLEGLIDEARAALRPGGGGFSDDVGLSDDRGLSDDGGFSDDADDD